MFEETEIKRVDLRSGSANLKDLVAREIPLTIKVNGKELITLLASPLKLKELAAGYLFVEGFISGKGDIKDIRLDEKTFVVGIETAKPINKEEVERKRVITSGCGRSISFYNFFDFKNCAAVESNIKVDAEVILSLTREFQKKSEVFEKTGGVHSAALCEENRIVSFVEDIGRHNAVDKIIGELVLAENLPKDKFLLLSGRVSSEMLLKCARIGIPIIVSRSAPTDMAVRLAKELKVALVGFARGQRMNIYSEEERII